MVSPKAGTILEGIPGGIAEEFPELFSGGVARQGCQMIFGLTCSKIYIPFKIPVKYMYAI